MVSQVDLAAAAAPSFRTGDCGRPSCRALQVPTMSAVKKENARYGHKPNHDQLESSWISFWVTIFIIKSKSTNTYKNHRFMIINQPDSKHRNAGGNSEKEQDDDDENATPDAAAAGIRSKRSDNSDTNVDIIRTESLRSRSMQRVPLRTGVYTGPANHSMGS